MWGRRGGGGGGVRKRGWKGTNIFWKKNSKDEWIKTSIKHQQQSTYPMYEKNFIDEIDHKYTIVHDG